MKKLIYCLGSVLLSANIIFAQGLPDDLVAYYPFNGDANNQAADVGDGTAVGAVLTADKDGNADSAYLFRGVRGAAEYIQFDQYDLDLPLDDAPRTLAAWVRCDSLENTSPNTIIGYGAPANDQHVHLQMLYADSSIRFGFWYNDVDINVGSPIDSEWHHVAGVFDGTNVSIYWDGELKGTAPTPNPVTTSESTNIQMRIGCHNVTQDWDPFGGAIDEVMIFSRALDGTEIASIKNYVTSVSDGNILHQISSFNLYQNYPNPFNPTTTIQFDVPKAGFYFLNVYNSLGQEVVTLLNANKSAGRYSIEFDASTLSSGVYFYRLSGSNVNLLNKMLLLK